MPVGVLLGEPQVCRRRACDPARSLPVAHYHPGPCSACDLRGAKGSPKWAWAVVPGGSQTRTGRSVTRARIWRGHRSSDPTQAPGRGDQDLGGSPEPSDSQGPHRAQWLVPSASASPLSSHPSSFQSAPAWGAEGPGAAGRASGASAHGRCASWPFRADSPPLETRLPERKDTSEALGRRGCSQAVESGASTPEALSPSARPWGAHARPERGGQ